MRKRKIESQMYRYLGLAVLLIVIPGILVGYLGEFIAEKLICGGLVDCLYFGSSRNVSFISVFYLTFLWASVLFLVKRIKFFWMVVVLISAGFFYLVYLLSLNYLMITNDWIVIKTSYLAFPPLVSEQRFLISDIQDIQYYWTGSPGSYRGNDTCFKGSVLRLKSEELINVSSFGLPKYRRGDTVADYLVREKFIPVNKNIWNYGHSNCYLYVK